MFGLDYLCMFQCPTCSVSVVGVGSQSIVGEVKQIWYLGDMLNCKGKCGEQEVRARVEDAWRN